MSWVNNFFVRELIVKFKKPREKVVYNVQCIYNDKHLFEKVFEIETGSEEKEETEVETFCPFCDKLVTVVVKGKVPPNKTVFRGAKVESSYNHGREKNSKK